MLFIGAFGARDVMLHNASLNASIRACIVEWCLWDDSTKRNESGVIISGLSSPGVLVDEWLLNFVQSLGM